MKKSALVIIGSILVSTSAYSAGPDFNSMINDGIQAEQALRQTLQGQVGNPQKELAPRKARVLRIANESGFGLPQNLKLTSAERELSASDDEFIDEELLGISEL